MGVGLKNRGGVAVEKRERVWHDRGHERGTAGYGMGGEWESGCGTAGGERRPWEGGRGSVMCG